MKHFEITEAVQIKKKLLEQAKETLKLEFVGIDEIIDEVMQLLTPWYLYPELQQKPTIINLWGMTGVGKTSLVKRLSSLLDMSNACHFLDMGLDSENFENFYSFFNRQVKRFPGEPFIMCLDEFQYANSKNEMGQELQKVYVRSIWEILDTGSYQRFHIDRWAKNELVDLIKELKYYVKRGIKVKNGIVVENAELFRMLEHSSSSNDWMRTEEEKKYSRFVKSKSVASIFDCSNRFSHVVELKDHLLTLNEVETIAFLEELLRETQHKEVVDCSKSLIFILGNLDEAFSFSSELSPDLSADEFYQRSKQINVNHIKRALQRRFRNEQIARLGNNHVIYPAFSSDSFDRIIRMELNKLAEKMKVNFDFNIVFSLSVRRMVYAEGVFPTQGTRPVYSTIQNLVEPFVSLIPAIAAENKLQYQNVGVSVEESALHIDFKDEEGQSQFRHTFPLKLKLTNLRQPKKDALQAVTAVHESGHAIAMALILGVLPRKIYSVTAEVGSSGMVTTETKERMIYSKPVCLGKAAVLLAGQAAEKVIFGEEHVTAGSSSDIRSATEIISDFVKKQGLAAFPYYVEVQNIANETSVYDSDGRFNHMVQQYLDEAYELAETTLKAHLTLLKEVARLLANRRMMRKEEFSDILAKYAPGNDLDLLLPRPFDYRAALYADVINNPAGIEHNTSFSLNKESGDEIFPV